MTVRPILFNTEMVRAILNGSKTETRRVIKNKLLKNIGIAEHLGEIFGIEDSKSKISSYFQKYCPFGAIGDQLFVQETYGSKIRSLGGTPHKSFVYKADNPNEIAYYDCNGKGYPVRWKPSSRMPRKASRILLEIVDIRVERLHEISDEDAKAEGFDKPKGVSTKQSYCSHNPVLSFQRHWESIKGKESWKENPWVWVIEFKVKNVLIFSMGNF
ncbi:MULTISPECIES: hypothetical protein [Acinetobacter calcoaceticus/baumannii complex]|uniref:Uncharacterized protein n=1 Tax=Acinetobacter baumannii 21072 TaxID=1310697 RepID=A0A062I860_ACIBA|nr:MULTISPECIES: hypothetical protein [Acinetobacter calcoaceticus/baumannii complex]KCY14083.1 hypothetical protein J596_3736 [Acinetobacter baumannii 21072]MBU3166901.1 hypothetical protein [Acinetobacter baumannii]MCU4548409.1 hypothetical protein [Acinetobacter pittii]PST51731.1 hypothetical protein CV950_018625 [Acinetobacter baumannii]